MAKGAAKSTKKTVKSSPKRAATPAPVAPTIASVPTPEGDTPRKLKMPHYKSFSLQKRIKPDTPPVPGSFRLLGMAFVTLKQNWKLFLGITFVYGLLSAVLVQGFAGAGDPTVAKTALNQALSGHLDKITSGTAAFFSLVGNSGNSSSPTSGTYEFVLTVVASLALIWALREVYNGNKPRTRDSFYKGMHPLVPFVLVFLVILVQCIPFAIGGYLYSTVMSNGVAASAVESVLWIVIFALLALTTLYMVTASIIALYLVTLYDIEPMQALRGAREIVQYRRWIVLRKILFLPLALLILSVVIVVPFILFVTPLAQVAFFVVSTAMVTVFHSYMFTLYRELL